MQACNVIIVAAIQRDTIAKNAPNGIAMNASRYVGLVDGAFAEHVILPNTKMNEVGGIAHRVQKSLKSNVPMEQYAQGEAINHRR